LSILFKSTQRSMVLLHRSTANHAVGNCISSFKCIDSNLFFNHKHCNTE